MGPTHQELTLLADAAKALLDSGVDLNSETKMPALPPTVLLTAAMPFFKEALAIAPSLVEKSAGPVRDVLVSRDANKTKKDVHMLDSIANREKHALAAIVELRAHPHESVQRAGETLQILVNDAGADSKVVHLLDAVLTSDLSPKKRARLAKQALMHDTNVRLSGIAAVVKSVAWGVASAVALGVIAVFSILAAGLADNFRRDPTFWEVAVRGRRIW